MGGPIERSNRDILEAQLAALETLLSGGTSQRYQMYGPSVVGIGETGEFGATLLDATGAVVDPLDITPGTWDLRRSRSGVVSLIADDQASQVLAGGIVAQHTFGAADWSEGDVFYFEFHDVVVDGYAYPVLYRMGKVSAATVEGKVDLLLLDTAAIIAAVGVVDGKADAILSAVGDLGTVDIAGVQATAGEIKAQTDKLKFSGDDVKATLDGETVVPGVGTITSAVIAANAIGASQIASNAIAAAKIATGAITDAKIASNAITNQKIAAGAIIAGHLAAGVIDSSKLANDTINASKVSADAVTKIQAGLPLLRQVPGQNLLRDTDGSCETATGWAAWGGNAPVASTEQVYGGTYSLKKVNAASNEGISTASGGPLVQGVTYRVRAKVWNVDAGSTLTVGMYNGRFEEHPATWSRTQAVDAGVWNTVDMLFTPLTTYATLSLVFRMSGGSGTWYLDEVSVTHADPVDMVVPATPRAGSLLDILHKNSSGTYSRATDSLEAIRDRIDTFLGPGFDAALHTALISANAGRKTEWLVKNAHDHMSVVKMQWTLSGTAGYLTIPSAGSAYVDLEDGAGAFSGTIRGPIEPGPVTIVTGTITGSGSFACIAQALDSTDTWRNVSGWTSGITGLTSNTVYQVTPPSIVIDGTYVKGLRYSLTAVGSPTITGSLQISAAWRHRVEAS